VFEGDSRIKYSCPFIITRTSRSPKREQGSKPMACVPPSDSG